MTGGLRQGMIGKDKRWFILEILISVIQLLPNKLPGGSGTLLKAFLSQNEILTGDAGKVDVSDTII